jgi:hypothetical protein
LDNSFNYVTIHHFILNGIRRRTALLERFQAKACPGLDPGWKPVRAKKTRQIENLEPRFDSIEAEKALVLLSQKVADRWI